MTRTIYVGKEAEVTFEADHGSQIVWISVCGKRVPVSVRSAQRAAVKLAEAARRASVRVP